MAIHYAMELDNKAVIKALQDMQGYIAKMNRLLEESGQKSDQTFRDITTGANSAAGGIKELVKQAAMFGCISLGAAGIKEFGAKVVEVRKQMQGLQISFETLLGSKEKADAMFGELKQFAATTPLMLKDLAAGAQTMLGFNIEAEKVVPTLKAIGDISMGDSQRFQSLSLAFSQMSATGKLMGQDLLQMINAGFNPLTEISRKTGKSISKLKDEMSKGAISAQMVSDAFISATQEGGKFYGMLEKQGEGLAGQFNQLQGAIDDMFNEIGEKTEGVIVESVSAVQSLVENYEKVGKVLLTLAATYGTYKAVLMATVAVEKTLAFAQTARTVLKLATSVTTATQAMRVFNAVCKTNPYVLLATVLISLVGSMVAISQATDNYVSSQDRANKAVKGFADAADKATETGKQLMSVIQDSNATDWEKAKAYNTLKTVCQELTDEYSLEELQVLSLKEAYEKLEEAQYNSKMAGFTQSKEDLVNMIAEIDRAGGSWSNLSKATEEYLETNGLTGKTLKEVRKDLQAEYDTIIAQEKALSDEHDLKSTISSVSTTKEKTEDEVKQEQKIADIRAQQAKEQARRQTDLQMEIEQARIDAMEDGTAKTIRQIELDYKKEEESIKRADEDLLAQKEKDARALWEANNTDKLATWHNTGSKSYTGSLTTDEKQASAQKDATATANYERKMAEATVKAEKEAMNKYLAEYGTMQEKKLAITQQYQDKIDKATTVGDRLSLQKELEATLSDLDMQSLRSDVNWSMLFGDLDKYTKDQLKALKPTIEKYRESDQYKNATEENKKAVDEAYANLERTILDKSGIFGGIGEALQQLSEAENELAEAEKRVRDTAEGTKEHEQAIKERNDAQSKRDNSQGNVKDASDKAANNIKSLANTITQLGNASEITLSDLGNVASQIASAFSEAGEKAGGWIAAIFAVCDMIAQDGIKGLYENCGKLIGSVLGGIFGIDIEESTRYYEEQKRLNDIYLDLIDETIQKQKELISEQSGIEAAETAESAKENLKKEQEINAENIRNYLDAGASKGFWGIGSSKSNGVALAQKLNARIFSGDYREIPEDEYVDISIAQRLAKILDVGEFSMRMKELANATVDQIELMKQDYELWAALPDEVRSYYEEILEAEDAIEEIDDTLRESLLGATFDNMKSSFQSAISDMTSTTADFADDFEDIMNTAIVNSLMNAKYSELIEQWYDDLAEDADKANGIQNMTAEAIESYRDRWKQISDDAKADADAAREIAGIDSSSSTASSTINASMSVTEDTANELVGRMTAMQISAQTRNSMLETISTNLMNALNGVGISNMHLNDLVDLAGERNGYLRDIYDRMWTMHNAISSKLDSIDTNTKNI